MPITKQIVNFKEFGRCADVTGANINNADTPGEFNIVYPCKQDPVGAGLAWNHKWYYNSPTVGYTNDVSDLGEHRPQRHGYELLPADARPRDERQVPDLHQLRRHQSGHHAADPGPPPVDALRVHGHLLAQLHLRRPMEPLPHGRQRRYLPSTPVSGGRR